MLTKYVNFTCNYYEESYKNSKIKFLVKNTLFLNLGLIFWVCFFYIFIRHDNSFIENNFNSSMDFQEMANSYDGNFSGLKKVS